MYNKKVYLCGPINGCTDEEANGWRDLAKYYLQYYDKDAFTVRTPKMIPIDPMKRDYRGQEGDTYREIVDLDKLDIRNSDALLVYYEKPSVGTSMEIFYAWTLGKPIVVVTPSGTNISPWLKYHSTKIIYSDNGFLNHAIDKAVSWIETI